MRPLTIKFDGLTPKKTTGRVNTFVIIFLFSFIFWGTFHEDATIGTMSMSKNSEASGQVSYNKVLIRNKTAQERLSIRKQPPL